MSSNASTINVGIMALGAVFLTSLATLVLVLTDFRGDAARARQADDIAKQACTLADAIRDETNTRAELFRDRSRISISVYERIADVATSPGAREVLLEGAQDLRDLNREIELVPPIDCADALSSVLPAFDDSLRRERR